MAPFDNSKIYTNLDRYPVNWPTVMRQLNKQHYKETRDEKRYNYDFYMRNTDTDKLRLDNKQIKKYDRTKKTI